MLFEENSYSVVMPVYNSFENLDSVVKEFEHVFIEVGFQAELILVDDASNEETKIKVEQIARAKNFVKTIRLKKNSGQIAATTCGIHYARGSSIITMDDDLQYPMQEVLKLIAHHQQSGKKIIFGYPRKRMHSFRHRIAAQLVIWLFDYIIMPRYRNINFYTTFRIFDRSLFFDEQNRILQRHLFYLWEIPVSDMDSMVVEHHVRTTGTSTYTLAKQVRHLFPQILITVLRLSLISLAAVIITAIVLVSFGLLQSTFFYVIATGSVFLSVTALIAKILLEKKRTVNYEIEKTTE